MQTREKIFIPIETRSVELPTIFSFIVAAHDARKAESAPSGKSAVGVSMLALQSTSMTIASLAAAASWRNKRTTFRDDRKRRERDTYNFDVLEGCKGGVGVEEFGERKRGELALR